MEGSKAFAKDFMARNNIPTAAFRTFAAHDVEGAVDYVKTCGHDVVLKASGLAGGKGVLIPANVDEAVKGLQEIMVDKAFGSAGQFSLLSNKVPTNLMLYTYR
jgi:phosphoribosylamine--glycine ligase/phosphoribosylformylglycinamidine cyclo-ligase